MDNIKKIVNFLFELSGAKTTARTGWQRIGIKAPESLADHSALSGQIAYVLALMEGANPDRAATLALFHDMAELRISDGNWVSRIYAPKDGGQDDAVRDQIAPLESNQFKSLFDEFREQKTSEAVIACDADYLDLVIQSKYYAENGNKKALLYSESIKDVFKTGSAKEIFFMIENSGIEDWWMELEAIKNKFESSRENK